MRVLVTGGTGFVGRHLRDVLASAGHSVRLALRRPTGDLAPSEEAVEVGDISANTDWDRALADIDTVVHAAARSGQDASRMLPPPVSAARDAEGTEQLAVAAAEARIRCFILVSSAKAVGERTPPGIAWDETATPAPLDCYGAAKLRSERAVLRQMECSAMQAVILRPPLIYGPGVKGNFRRLLRLADSSLPLPFACIRNRRSMIYVLNLCDAIQRAIERGPQGRFFVDDGEAISTADLMRRLRLLMGRPPRLLPVPSTVLSGLGRALGQRDAVDRITGSLLTEASALRNAMAWLPPYSLDQGLAATVRWYKERPRSASLHGPA